MEYIKSKDLNKFEHLQIPRSIWELFLKKEMTQTAFKIYVEFFDRIKLSRYNKWINKEGNVFIKYSYDELMDILSVKSKGTISESLKELKKLNLLIQEKGFNTSSKFYLANVLKSTVVQSAEHSSTVCRTQSSEKLDANHNNFNHNNNKKNTAVAVTPRLQYLKRYKEFVVNSIPDVNIQVLDSQIMRLKKHIDNNLLEELEKSSYLKGLKDKKPGVWVFTVVKNINDIKLGVYRDKEVSQEEKNTPSRRVL